MTHNNYYSRIYQHTMHPQSWKDDDGRIKPWFLRHIEAIREPRSQHIEQGIVLMLKGFLIYADAHHNAYESGIGKDWVLGPHWKAIGEGIRGLLNGTLGRLDAGLLDSIIANALHDEGLIDE